MIIQGKVSDGVYYCPKGHRTSQRINKNTNAENMPIWCKHCKKAYYPRIKDGVLQK